MPILLYCVTEKSELPNLGTGVAGVPVLTCEQGELAALFSQGVGAESWVGTPLKASARQFHQVLHRVFASRAIIPFRFPTLMREAEELAAHMRANAREYLAQLGKFRTSVQMDITVVHSNPLATRQSSGAEYLYERRKQSEELDRFAKTLYAHTDSATRDWRTRPAQHGLKILALLDRDSIAVFNRSLQAFAVPPGLSIRISGPWPVTEFLELTQSR